MELDSILSQYRAELRQGLNQLAGHDPLEQAKSKLTKYIEQERLAGGYRALNDLKTWAELHQLNAEMIMDGIEHMMSSIAQQQNGEIEVQPNWKSSPNNEGESNGR